MSNQPIEKPQFPPNVSSWWRKKMSELTPEQANIKRQYVRDYNQWRKQSKPKKERKLPEGVSSWWSKPNHELSSEQLEIRRAYFKQDKIAEHQKEYAREYNKRIKEYARKYKESINI